MKHHTIILKSKFFSIILNHTRKQGICRINVIISQHFAVFQCFNCLKLLTIRQYKIPIIFLLLGSRYICRLYWVGCKQTTSHGNCQGCGYAIDLFLHNTPSFLKYIITIIRKTDFCFLYHYFIIPHFHRIFIRKRIEFFLQKRPTSEDLSLIFYISGMISLARSISHCFRYFVFSIVLIHSRYPLCRG